MGKIYKNNNYTCLIHNINTYRIPQKIFDTLPRGLIFKQLPHTRQMIMHKETCLSPIINAENHYCEISCKVMISDAIRHIYSKYSDRP